MTSGMVSLRVNSDCSANGASSKAISALKTTLVSVKSPMATLYDRFTCPIETGLWPMIREYAILTTRQFRINNRREVKLKLTR